MSFTDPATSEQLFLWLSVFDSAGQPRLELVKTGVGLDDDELIASTIYSDVKAVHEGLIPFQRTLVQGLKEDPVVSVITTAIDPQTRTDIFEKPD